MDLDRGLVYEPKRVVSIVCPSRSGSTVLKHALCLHPDLTTLAGEEEPYYKLAHCGYPWHPSDEFHSLDEGQRQDVLWCIANEVHNHSNAENRQWLQEQQIEEPPYVKAIECRRTDTLVLKTPQNCYRRGVIEQLYPQAEVAYIAIERDARAVVNGLIDGWRSGQFTARKTHGGWWCFDMPPNWTWGVPLLVRCLNQYAEATRFIKRDYAKDLLCTVRFEHFEANWLAVCRDTWEVLGLPPYTPSVQVLPKLSCTYEPRPERWRSIRPWLEEAVDAWMENVLW